MFLVNDLKFYLGRLSTRISRLKDDKELINLLENYKLDPEISKINEIMLKDADYRVAGMSSPNDKKLFHDIYEMDYKHLADDTPYYSIGIFILPKSTKMPIHDHRNMLVFTKLLCGRAEVKSYDKIGNQDLDEQEFEVKLAESKIYKEGDLTVLTPMNKNIHEITALEDSAFLDILVPDYRDDNQCNYFKLKHADYKMYLSKIKYF